MHLILTGATGYIGTGVFACMLKTKGVTKITVLSRRPVRFADEVNDPRVNVIIHPDFSKYNDSSLYDQIKDATGCVWALGSTSVTLVSREEYIMTTKDWAVEAAKEFAKLGSPEKPFRFVYVSGMGATVKPGLFTTLYHETKGEAEVALAKIAEDSPSLMVLTPRPGAVDIAGLEEVKKYGPKRIPMHKALQTFGMTPIRLMHSSIYGTSQMLGDVYTQLAMGMHDEQLADVGAIQLGTRSWALQHKSVRQLAGL